MRKAHKSSVKHKETIVPGWIWYLQMFCYFDHLHGFINWFHFVFLLRKLDGHGQIFKSQWTSWRYSLRNREYLILGSAEQWMRYLLDLSDQKPQNQNSQNPQFAFKQLLPLLFDHVFWHVTLSWCSDYFRPRSWYFAFKHTSKPGKGLKWSLWINAILETLCSSVLTNGTELYFTLLNGTAMTWC